MTRIAIDAMGGDHAPHEIVAGAVWAAKEYGVAIELVGKQDRIEQELDKISHEGFMTDYGKGGAAKYRVKIDTSKLDISSHSENSYSKTDVYYFFPFYIQIPRKHNRKSNST